MFKNVLFSAKMEHDVIKTVIPILKKKIKGTNLMFHDPTKDFFDLEDMRRSFSEVDLMIVKVGSECSLDLLHFAKLYNIPTLHDIDTVLICKNKVDICGFGRMALANPNFPKQIFQEGLIDKKQVCITCSKCSEFMKIGQNVGCATRDLQYK